MRVALALILVALSAGCAAFAPPEALLRADDAGKVKEEIAVRFTFRNVGDEELRVHPSQFRVVGGTALFRCMNQAASWKLIEPAPPLTEEREALLAPDAMMWGYLQIGLCPDVAGPYTLEWQGVGKHQKAESSVPIRSLDPDTPLDPITALARAWDEDGALL